MNESLEVEQNYQNNKINRACSKFKQTKVPTKAHDEQVVNAPMTS